MSEVIQTSDQLSPAQTLGLQIAKRRHRIGDSQREMARATGIQQTTVAKIERGERIPTREQARDLAQYFLLKGRDYALTELHLSMPDVYPAPGLPEAA